MDQKTKQDWKELNKQRKERKKRKLEQKLIKESIKEQEQPKNQDGDSSTDQKSAGRSWTLSMALPASILLNAQSAELRTYLAGQIARAAAIFNIDEIVVFDEFALSVGEDMDLAFDERKKCVQQLAKILEYLECPQYLRKFLFPLQQDLKYAGLLNPLDCQHHLRTYDLELPYREGIVSNKPVKENSASQGSYIYVGLETEVQIDRIIKPGVRVTVQYDPNDMTSNNRTESPEKQRRKHKKIKGKAVAPSKPRTDLGLYWGYTVRTAGSLSSVFSESTFKEGYDLLIGTSERGDNLDNVDLPKDFKHALIVFGGVKGLEAALDSDEKLSQVDDPKDLFGYYLNTCPNQGSNTIRTEEAILITLSALRPRLCNR